MAWFMGKEERLTCPEVYQDRLARIGGLNRFGQPNFIIVWSQTHTSRRASVDGNYEDYLTDFNVPGWVLKQWRAPEEYGTPELYYIQNYDEATGLCLLGEYPYRGRYETIESFKCKTLVNGRLIVEFMPLNSMILDMIVPIIMQAKDVSLQRQKAAFMALEEKKKQAETDRIADALQDAMPAFTEPVSFGGQGCRTSLIDKKVEQIERSWSQAMKRVKQLGLGISVSK